MTKVKEVRVAKAALRVVPLGQLRVDPSYQRDVKPRHKKIAAEFNEDALGVPLVGQREDGTLWVVDGLQRTKALELLGKATVRAEVFVSQGPEHEAAVFKLVNLNRTRLTVGEQFRALLTAHDPLAWSIKEAVEGCGFRLGLTAEGARKGRHASAAGAKEVLCLSSLLKVARGHGTEPIRFALRVADAAWPGDRLGVYALMVQGLATFHVRSEPLDEARLVARLQAVTPHKVLYAANNATMAGDKSFAVAAELERLYRKRVSPRRGA